MRASSRNAQGLGRRSCLAGVSNPAGATAWAVLLLRGCNSCHPLHHCVGTCGSCVSSDLSFQDGSVSEWSLTDHSAEPTSWWQPVVVPPYRAIRFRLQAWIALPAFNDPLCNSILWLSLQGLFGAVRSSIFLSLCLHPRDLARLAATGHNQGELIVNPRDVGISETSVPCQREDSLVGNSRTHGSAGQEIVTPLSLACPAKEKILLWVTLEFMAQQSLSRHQAPLS